jgi:hypothetical protein
MAETRIGRMQSASRRRLERGGASRARRLLWTDPQYWSHRVVGSRLGPSATATAADGSLLKQRLCGPTSNPIVGRSESEHPLRYFLRRVPPTNQIAGWSRQRGPREPAQLSVSPSLTSGRPRRRPADAWRAPSARSAITQPRRKGNTGNPVRCPFPQCDESRGSLQTIAFSEAGLGAIGGGVPRGAGRRRLAGPCRAEREARARQDVSRRPSRGQELQPISSS